MASNEQARSTTADAVSISTGDAPVRPKILKRPAQFSTATARTTAPLPPHAALIVADAPIAAPTANTLAPSKAWQDDGRFAIALLAIVIVMNIALSYWLSHVKHRPMLPEASISDTVQAPAAHLPVTVTEMPMEEPAQQDTTVHMLEDDAAAPDTPTDSAQ